MSLSPRPDVLQTSARQYTVTDMSLQEKKTLRNDCWAIVSICVKASYTTEPWRNNEDERTHIGHKRH